MTYYEFQDQETMERVSIDVPMDDICSWGEVMEIDGRRYKRLVSAPNVQPEFRPFASITQAPVFDKAQQMEMIHAGQADAFDSESRPEFHTKKTAKKYADATGGAVKWDH